MPPFLIDSKEVEVARKRFAACLASHLVGGARPTGSPAWKTGPWQPHVFANDIGLTEAAVALWLAGGSLPTQKNFEKILKTLFGDDHAHTQSRQELAELYQVAIQKQKKFKAKRTEYKEQINETASLASGAEAGHHMFSDLVQSGRLLAQAADPETQPPTPAEPQPPAIFYVPVRTPEHFIGREAALTQIEASLKRAEGRVVITALHGMRGVGKTVLAAEYAQRHRTDHRITWWLNAESEESTKSGILALGRRLNWVTRDDDVESAVRKVMERLVSNGDGVLLIYDNVTEADGLLAYLPVGGNAKVIVTTNSHAWGRIAEPIRTDVWSKETGATFLIARTRSHEGDRAAAEALSELLGGLPLALEQAAAYCENLAIGFAEYERRFQEIKLELLDDADHAPADYSAGREGVAARGRLTVAGTFRLAIRAAAERHSAATQFLMYLAALAAHPIPRFLFVEGGKAFPEPLASALAGDGLDRIVAALLSFALVDAIDVTDRYDDETIIAVNCLRLHRLVRDIVSQDVGDMKDEVTGRLTLACGLAWPSHVFERYYAEEGTLFFDPDLHTRYVLLEPLSWTLLISDCMGLLPREAIEMMYLIVKNPESELRPTMTAIALFCVASVIFSKLLGPDHPITIEAFEGVRTRYAELEYYGVEVEDVGDI